MPLPEVPFREVVRARRGAPQNLLHRQERGNRRRLAGPLKNSGGDILPLLARSRRPERGYSGGGSCRLSFSRAWSNAGAGSAVRTCSSQKTPS